MTSAVSIARDVVTAAHLTRRRGERTGEQLLRRREREVVPVVSQPHDHHRLARPVEQLTTICRPQRLVTTVARHAHGRPTGIALHPDFCFARYGSRRMRASAHSERERDGTRRTRTPRFSEPRRTRALRWRGYRGCPWASERANPRRPTTPEADRSHSMSVARADGSVSRKCQDLRVGSDGEPRVLPGRVPDRRTVVVPPRQGQRRARPQGGGREGDRVLGQPHVSTKTRAGLLAFAQRVETAADKPWEKKSFPILRQNALRMMVAASPDLQTA